MFLLRSKHRTCPPRSASPPVPSRRQGAASQSGGRAPPAPRGAEPLAGAETHLRPKTVDVCFLSSAAPHAVCTRHDTRHDTHTHTVLHSRTARNVTPPVLDMNSCYMRVTFSTTGTRPTSSRVPHCAFPLINFLYLNLIIFVSPRFMNASCAHGTSREGRGRADSWFWFAVI